ncbi:MAG TPA: biotin carboxylase N-terminal domain-containing protein [Acidimicrobiales bacterium]|jgi:acetyl-CoA/propionyl-CoA carboxylase biotin carboxyl carrier protein|nr:biotin carboxylase N-terminal domain-containing protein [Acidimicrobiales bacterium]
MFDTVLVANRGEIAVRIMATLRRLGIRSIGVYSDDDHSARHVRDADQALRLGPASAAESYLSIDRLLAAAHETGAQAVHPGYGFLAENADFATACRQAGITFIGPPTGAITIMGDKIRAKRAVSAAGVPVVPGRTDTDMSDDDLVQAADEVGYPVLVKPSAGGGGKGMRLVHDPARLRDELASARREARASFGDDTLFLERFVLSPRHIEVQVLADAFGTVVHLGERECSLQRRHQKIIEETPSVLLDHMQRAAMGAAAVDIARAVNYEGAGTVEFIVSADAPDEFFFMEMNTRLQVEHPVTEMVTGIDLVEQQLRVAAGESLSFSQADITFNGHAVEARIYAENPSRGFVPSGGDLLHLHEPVAEGVRVDSSLLGGGVVGTTYDPMLSKVVAWGADRAVALARLDQALAHSVVLGFPTNINFLRSLLRHPAVQSGQLDTELVERELTGLIASATPPEAYVVFALDRLLRAQPLGRVVNRWDVADGWRLGGPDAPTEWQLAGPDGTPVAVQVTGRPDEAKVAIDGNTPVLARVEALSDGLLVTIDGHRQRAIVAATGATTWVWLDGETFAFSELAPQRRGSGAGAIENEVRSPMPGTVITVNVQVGDEVEQGDALLIVEAMKMEYTLVAPRAGRIVQVKAGVGDRVLVDAPLVHLEAVSETMSMAMSTAMSKAVTP